LAPVIEDRFAISVEEAHAELFGDIHQEEELLQMVNTIVETLPAGLREVFVLREVNGMSYQETALIMGCSEEAARMRLSRARGAIRRALIERGFSRVESDQGE
jgi:RNA polymerase sigma factor (sigma-70 family)